MESILRDVPPPEPPTVDGRCAGHCGTGPNSLVPTRLRLLLPPFLVPSSAVHALLVAVAVAVAVRGLSAGAL